MTATGTTARTNQHAETPSPDVAPAPPATRDIGLDAVRGLGVLGILIVNITYAAFPFDMTVFRPMPPDTPFDRAAMDTLEVLAAGKFMAIFSMLFGVGVLLFAQRFDHPPDGSRPPISAGTGRWHRRMLALLAIGIMHIVFGWPGDILTAYAIAGIAGLWWVRRWPAPVLAAVAAAASVIGTLIFVSLLGMMMVMPELDPEAAAAVAEDEAARIVSLRDGGYLDVLLYNLSMLPDMVLMALMTFPLVTGLMLLGMSLHRWGYFAPARSARFYTRVAAFGIGGGALLSLLVFLAMRAIGAGDWWAIAAQPIGLPLAIGYTALIMRLSRTPFAGPAIAVLAATGRTALSNYLLQTLCMSFVFYGWGLGLITKVGSLTLLGVVAVIWALCLAWPPFWLARFRFGPAEWGWRRLTYGAAAGPIRRSYTRSNA
ncbi:MAG: DUF418 domain-containing protein [Planctomycetota bacterium]